ncbi:MAG: class I SAM-dependent methyltransferase [Burkholderiaceae bacterium]|nr:class I SAM-dependent methyltransferase [Burkholderiaceae bacterium]
MLEPLRLALSSPIRKAALAFAAAMPALSASAQDEVPFVVSPEPVTLAMLTMASVGPRDVVLDLGSGDGRIVITAAKRFGARGLGVELSPQLVEKSRDNARRAGVAERAQFRMQDLFETDLSQASVITMYLLPEVNLQLRPKLLALKPGTRIVSHDWDMGDWKPDRTLVVDAPDKPVGLEKKSRVHFWRVPARLAGLWCAQDAALRLEQTFQQLNGQFMRADASLPFDARIDGTAVNAGRPQGRLRMVLQRETLRVDLAQGRYRALHGLAFVRSSGAGCP